MSRHDPWTAELFVTPAQHSQHGTLTRLMATVDGRKNLGATKDLDSARFQFQSPRNALQRALIRACDGGFAVAVSGCMPRGRKSPIVIVRTIEHQGNLTGRLQGLAIERSVVELDLIPRDADIVDFISTSWRQGEREEVSFSEHVGRYMQLIQDLYRATDRDARLHAERRLTQYVYLSCYPKILERLCHGTGQRKWFDILSRRVEDISGPAKRAWVPRSLTKHAWTKLRPNQGQQAWIKATWAYDPKLHDDMLQFPLYDQLGRLRVQSCLSKLLHHLAKAVLDLKQYAENPPKHRGRNTPTPRTLVIDVQLVMSYLMSFLTEFSLLMVPHIKWLQEYWEPSERPVVVLDLGQNSRDDQEYPELQDLQQGDEKAGPLLRYLWLLCDHQVSLMGIKNSVENYNKAAPHILNADVNVVDLYYDSGNAPQSFLECLNDLYDKSIDPRSTLERCSRVSGQPLAQRDTLHPAAALVALLANAQSYEVKVAISRGLLREIFPVTREVLRLFKGMEFYLTTTQLRCPSCYCLLHAAAQADPPQIGMHGKLPAATSATKWQPCLLPPFIPRELGRDCMRDFEYEATRRLKCVAENDEVEVMQIGPSVV